MSLLTKLKHLKTMQSVHWGRAALSALRLWPDYYLSEGTTSSLVNVTLELTYRCNFLCNFCFLKDNVLNRRVTELSFDEIKAIVDEVAPMKLGFYLTGGEPFVRRDCIDIIEYIKTRGLKCGANTNGMIMTHDMMDRMQRTGMDYVIVSIHGRQKQHDEVVGVKSFDKVVGNVKYLTAMSDGPAVVINFVITDETCKQMTDMVEIAADCGVDALTFQHETFLTKHDREKHQREWRCIMGEDAELSFIDYDPGHYDIKRLQAHIDETRDKAKALGVTVFFKPDLQDKELENWYSSRFHGDGKKCSYIYTDARINPEGDVIACQFITQKMGNVREHKLLDLMNNERFKEFRNGIKQNGGLFSACARCCKLYRAF